MRFRWTQILVQDPAGEESRRRTTRIAANRPTHRMEVGVYRVVGTGQEGVELEEMEVEDTGDSHLVPTRDRRRAHP